MLQQTFKNIECLQTQQTIIPLSVDAMLKWCSNFVVAPKPNEFMIIFGSTKVKSTL